MTQWWERLARIIEEKRLDVRVVAFGAGVNDKTLYGYLKGGTASPRGDVVARLAIAVGVTEQYLRYGSPDERRGFSRVPLLAMNELKTLRPGEDPRIVWDGVSVTV